MLNHSICGLEPIIYHEVIKVNLQTFEKAYILAEPILQLHNLVSGGSIYSKWCKSLDYALIELDSIGTNVQHCQFNIGGTNNQHNNPHAI